VSEVVIKVRWRERLARIPEWGWLAGLLVVLGCGQWFLMSSEFGIFHDPTVYLEGAESLATTGGYRFAAHAGRPVIGLYPPLHSAWLALGWKAWPQFPENLVLLRMQMLGLSLAAVAAAFGVMRRLGSPLGLTLGFCLNLGWGMRWNEGLTWFMSDAAMMAILLGLAAVWLGGGEERRGWVGWMLSGWVLAMAVGWRTAAAGAVLGAGVAVMWGGLREGGWLRVGLLAGPPLLVALGWNRWAEAGVSYGGAFRIILGNAGGGWVGYGRKFLEQLWETLSGRPFLDGFLLPVSRLGLVMEQRAGWVGTVLVLVIAVVAWAMVWNAVRSVGRTGSKVERVLAGGVLGYLLLVFAAPNGESSMGRYFLPVLPLLVAWGWRGWSEVGGERARRRVGWMVMAVLLVAVPANVKMSMSAKQHWNGFHDLADLEPFSRWVGAGVERDAVIAMDWSLPVLHFRAWSGRPVVADGIYTKRSFSPVKPPLEPPTHVVVGTVGWDQYTPPEGFVLLHASPAGKYRLYAVPEGYRIN